MEMYFFYYVSLICISLLQCQIVSYVLKEKCSKSANLHDKLGDSRAPSQNDG